MMRFKIGNDRRSDWRCCFCCHVRTGTIFLGLWHLLLHILALSVIAVILRNPELMVDYSDDSYSADDTGVSNQNKLNLAPVLPTPLSSEFGENDVVDGPSLELDINLGEEKVIINERILIERVETITEPMFVLKSSDDVVLGHSVSEETDEKRQPPKKYHSFSFGAAFRDILGTRTISNHDLNAGIVVTFCTFIITLLMVYGAVRNKPSYLMPFFCLQVFDFCIACLTTVGYLCYLPDVRRMVIESHNLPFADQLQDLNPQCLSILLLLMFTLAMGIKAYFIGVVWRCYKYLALRRMTQLRTVHFIDSPPETMGATPAPDSPLSHQEALLLLPDYETAVNDPRYAVALPTKGEEKGKKCGGSAVSFDSLVMMAPPPAYSSVVQDANQVVPQDAGIETPAASQERAVPSSPQATPARDLVEEPSTVARSTAGIDNKSST